MATKVRQRIRSVEDDLDAYLSKRRTIFGISLLSPAIIVFSLVSIFPLLFGIWISFYSGLRLEDLEFVMLANYTGLIGNERFISSIVTGAIFAGYSVLLQMIVGVAIALIINKTFKFANVVRSIVLIPYMIPTVAVALVFRWFASNQFGLLNYLLLEAGVIANELNFFSPDLAMHSVVWISSWKFTIFIVLVILARLQSIDQALYEAAKVNGANTVNQFFDVTLPQIKSALFLVLLLRTIWMFNKFDIIWLLTRGGPFRVTETMVVYAFREGILQLKTGIGAAISVVIFLIMLITSAIYFKVFNPEQEVEVT